MAAGSFFRWGCRLFLLAALAAACGHALAHEEAGGTLVSVSTPAPPGPKNDAAKPADAPASPAGDPAAAPEPVKAGEASQPPAAEVVEIVETLPAKANASGWGVGSVAGQQKARDKDTRGTPKPGDPEWVRTFPDDGDDAGAEPRASKPAKRHAPRRGDPEFGRTWPEGGDLERLVEAPGPREPRAPRAAPAFEDRPRFVMGEGIDDEAADLGNFQPLAVLPPDPVAPAPKPDPKAEAKKLAMAKKAKEKEKEKPAPTLPPDTPEAEKALMEERLAQIKEQQAVVAEERARLKEAEAKTQEEGDEGATITTHSRKAAQAIRTFSNGLAVAVITGQVIDPETRQAIPARVKIVDGSDTAAGSAVPDLGFWCEGAFRVPVAPGKIHVEIRAGRFRRMLVKDIAAQPGEAIVLTEELARPAYLNFARDGWYCADLNYALRARRGEIPLWTGEVPQIADAVLAARAEGVEVLGLSMPWGRELENQDEAETLAAFERESRGLLALPAFPGPQHPFCGSGFGVGMQAWKEIPRHLSDPRSPLRDGFDEIRRTGGLAVFTELGGRASVDPRKSITPLFPRLLRDGIFTPEDATALLYAPAELPFDTISGPAYDALAFDGSESAEALWFMLLNEGYAIPVVGPGGGCLESGTAPLGQTYVKVAGALTREKVLQACREGRSFVSFGPAVFAHLVERDKGPGDRLPSDGRIVWHLKVRAYSSMQPGTSLQRVELIRNGKVVQAESCETGMSALNDLRLPITERADAWYVVRVTEVTQAPGQPAQTRRAYTNPIYFDTPGRAVPRTAKVRMTGTLRLAGGTPTAGKLTVLEPGQEPRETEVGPDGRYAVTYLSSGAVIFEAKGCEPVARKAFDNPQAQKALGVLLTEREGKMRDLLARPATLGYWRMILSDWQEDITLNPIRLAPAPAREPRRAPEEKSEPAPPEMLRRP
ncbi:MAG: hypothetical protein KIS92_13355 [Planctomycetota bacterium]|nr:hypothetical protein [Planctomycetota bacterium]